MRRSATASRQYNFTGDRLRRVSDSCSRWRCFLLRDVILRRAARVEERREPPKNGRFVTDSQNRKVCELSLSGVLRGQNRARRIQRRSSLRVGSSHETWRCGARNRNLRHHEGRSSRRLALASLNIPTAKSAPKSASTTSHNFATANPATHVMETFLWHLHADRDHFDGGNERYRLHEARSVRTTPRACGAIHVMTPVATQSRVLREAHLYECSANR